MRPSWNSLPSRSSALRWRPSDEAAGGVAVEPMGERRRARQAEAQRVEMILEIVAALGAAMHGQAGRLVDDEHQPVAVEQARERRSMAGL